MSQEGALSAFMTRLGYRFKSQALLHQALRHAGLDVDDDNERLEFLGDRVLGLVIADALMIRHSDEKEGSLSRRLSVLVSGRICADVAGELNLASVLETDSGMGEKLVSGNVLGDACEAILGAVYLDGGLVAAREVILRLWQPHFEAQTEVPIDAKSALQEWLMKRGSTPPDYKIVERSGPAHAPLFKVQVVSSQGEAESEGNSRRTAEQRAAAILLDRLEGEE